MSYEIIISKSVQKQIDNLPNEFKTRILEKIEYLRKEPRPVGVVKMKGYDNEYRLRVGDYRVRYEINDSNRMIQLLQCKHRKEIYRL
ncbi:type II toxin-antitoxin system RelE family toxin [Aphanothece sacrum]|uniref:Plasmid stabilization system protein like n=1 Tax=Aphanothece sacrum FPU1 TaxID=1920663 RepID=A0A401IFS3_APHSA|nr:type II toxin-antitoxin system RelE/ParE family toxin [Aphanothece sacrum]GBF80135.1 plasmid stabilization system protein like [Aphanothece sacrum FPU1]